MGDVALAVRVANGISRSPSCGPDRTSGGDPLADSAAWRRVGPAQATGQRILILRTGEPAGQPGQAQGLRRIAFNEALGSDPVPAGSQVPAICSRAGICPHPGSAASALAAQRANRRSRWRQLLVARMEDGVVKYQDHPLLQRAVQWREVVADRRAAKEVARACGSTPRGVFATRKSALRRMDPAPAAVVSSSDGRVGSDGGRADRLTWEDRREHRQAGNRQERGIDHPLRSCPRTSIALGADRVWGRRKRSICTRPANSAVCGRSIRNTT